ncbi:MAG: hypothetical protein PUG20_03780 [Chlamydia suis]|nr:hypothetical protein [Chlamydia suis]MDY4960579.1 hypothetical protein [Chlamydia suis]
MFSISPCCNPCKPACAERLDAREVSDSQGKSLAITSLVLGILAVLGSAILLLCSGSFVSFFAAILGLLAMTIGSAALGGSLVYFFSPSLGSISPSVAPPLSPSQEGSVLNMVRSYQELLNEAEADLKEVEGLLTQKEQKLESLQTELNSLRQKENPSAQTSNSTIS